MIRYGLSPKGAPVQQSQLERAGLAHNIWGRDFGITETRPFHLEVSSTHRSAAIWSPLDSPRCIRPFYLQGCGARACKIGVVKPASRTVAQAAQVWELTDYPRKRPSVDRGQGAVEMLGKGSRNESRTLLTNPIHLSNGVDEDFKVGELPFFPYQDPQAG